MEAAENTFVERTILWLARGIMESLLAGKIGEWIRQFGPAEDIDKLKSEIERVETVVAAVKGRATRNKPLARSLARIKELLYDADDLVDELDYFRLQEQVKGASFACANEPEGTDGGGAAQADTSCEIPDISSGKERKNRSKAWDHFEPIKDVSGKTVKAKCRHCHKEVKYDGMTGTKGLIKHSESKKCRSKRPATDQPQNPISDAAPNDTTNATSVSVSTKRMRVDEVSTCNMAAIAHPWNNAISKRIHQISFQLCSCRGDVGEFLKDSVASTDLHQSNISDTHLRTSSLVPRKVYGRDVEEDYIIRVITAAESDVITVLPIVGIVGVGKTTVAQLVYNDPTVGSQFELIWVWVSDMFDKVRLTKEMLDVVSLESYDGSPHNKESHAGINNYSKLQEILKDQMGRRLQRFLLVLDDVTDCMDNHRWNELLSPLKSSQKKGNVIVLTTRNLSVARRLGTVEPIKLGALENDAFWLLFKACAFGDDNYEGPPGLTIIGRRIAAKLKGNPLAAETTGEVLKEHLTIDHWSTILKSEEWKSMQLNTGIMHALMLSFDNLPYHLQQCFLYCSIFPHGHKFLAEDLVCTWISLGFVRCINSSKTPEEIGRDCLNDLVNLCFFEQVTREKSIPSQKTEESTPRNGPSYVMCGIVHEFARVVSGTEFATMCGLECNEMLPTIRHLSILTDSAYCNKDEHGSILHNKKFEEKMPSIVPLVRNLRTLILIGSYKCFFFQSFQEILPKARNLRLLQLSATQADFRTFMCNSVNPTHLRYLKFENNGRAEALPIPLSKFYHLEVLNAGHPDIVHGMNDLNNMRYLFVKKGGRSSVPSVGEMSNGQDMQNSTDKNFSHSEIAQLQCLNKLVQLGVFELGNISRAEADGAKLRDKQQLEKLHLSWKNTLLQVEHDSGLEAEEDGSDTEAEKDGSDTEAEEDGSDTEAEEDGSDTEAEEESNTIGDNNPDFAQYFSDMEVEEESHRIDMAQDVLGGLEPHHNLKHLQISGYSGATNPAWLSTSVTFLQTLHLEDCGKWEILPSLERLPFLTKLKLSNMQKVNKVSIPSLEELVLINMPRLECCSCGSVMNLNTSLKVLKIKRCHGLKSFPLFESCNKLKIEHNSWLSYVKELTIDRCTHLKVSNPLPPSGNVCKLYIRRVPALPKMMGSSREELIIQPDGFSTHKLTELDDKILAFHNLRALGRLKISRWPNLISMPLKGFSQLISLKSLEIVFCEQLFSSDVLPEHAREDMADANFNAFPSLKHLRILSCGIAGKWLSVMLRHAPALEELDLSQCHQISELLIERNETSSSNHTTTPRAPSPGNPDDALTSSIPDGLLRIPSNLVSSLKEMSIAWCKELTIQGSKEGFSGFISLEKLSVQNCPKLIPCLVQKYENFDQLNGRWLLPYSIGELIINYSAETLQLCFPEDFNCLKKFTISNSPSLISLQMRSFTALEELKIRDCGSLDAIEGFEILSNLRSLHVYSCPGLPPCLERLSNMGYELCPRLESLDTNHYSFLASSFFKCLSSLQRLKFGFAPAKGQATRLTDEQERGLQLLTSLQELRFDECYSLADLPVGLHSLSSLKKLFCRSFISRLPEKGLPPSLEELEIYDLFGHRQLSNECRILARTRSKPKVKINGKYVN